LSPTAEDESIYSSEAVYENILINKTPNLQDSSETVYENILMNKTPNLQATTDITETDEEDSYGGEVLPYYIAGDLQSLASNTQSTKSLRAFHKKEGSYISERGALATEIGGCKVGGWWENVADEDRSFSYFSDKQNGYTNLTKEKNFKFEKHHKCKIETAKGNFMEIILDRSVMREATWKDDDRIFLDDEPWLQRVSNLRVTIPSEMNSLKIRKGPATEYQEIGKLKDGQIIFVKAIVNDWVMHSRGWSLMLWHGLLFVEPISQTQSRYE